jgi:hypothetical protein
MVQKRLYDELPPSLSKETNSRQNFVVRATLTEIFALCLLLLANGDDGTTMMTQLSGFVYQ